MDKFIKKELEKCKIAKIKYNEESTEIFIPQLKEIPLKEDSCYLIELSDNILKCDPSSPLMVNWNQSNPPKHKYYKVDILKIFPDMVKINGLAFDFENDSDLNECWEGWIPKEDINIIKEL